MSLRRWAAVVTVGILMGACANSPPAPVEDRSARGTAGKHSGNDYGPALKVGKPYTVRPGDTLYQIAFRLGLDYKALARRNAIKAPYTIFPGQVLATDLRKPATAATPTSKTQRTRTKAVSKPAPAKPAVTIPKPAPKPAARPKPAPSTANKPVSRWRWPTSGKVTRGYSNNLHKGIDIAGKRGDPVRAVAAGSVVYAGTGVTGYGALIIVKHNDDYLSAYGHNDAILVQEGAIVSAGQQIARMGSTGTDSVKLHFEIRRRGKPVDPLKILPRR